MSFEKRKYGNGWDRRLYERPSKGAVTFVRSRRRGASSMVRTPETNSSALHFRKPTHQKEETIPSVLLAWRDTLLFAPSPATTQQKRKRRNNEHKRNETNDGFSPASFRPSALAAYVGEKRKKDRRSPFSSPDPLTGKWACLLWLFCMKMDIHADAFPFDSSACFFSVPRRRGSSFLDSKKKKKRWNIYTFLSFC